MINESQLSRALEKLRLEIEALDTADEESRRKLEQLVADLESKLENPEDTELHEDLAEQLRDSMLEFEVSHPRLTSIMNDIMMKLSNMGI
jgi:predicted transcriptional regulator